MLCWTVAVLAAPAVAFAGEAELAELARQRGLDPETVSSPLRLNDEMKAWARQRVSRAAPAETRLKILLESLRSTELDFLYKAGYTGTAEEVFTSGEYNCLSFSMLFVSMARELGLPAVYLDVHQIQSYTKVGDLVVVSGHITAGYGAASSRTVLEFNVGPEINYQAAVPISDLEAMALYYSNRGAELLRDGDAEQAIERLETAIALVPELAQAWINLGVAQRRSGDEAAAEQAYRTAIDLAPNTLPAYQNLSALLRLRGEEDAAGELLELLDRRGNRNPFMFLALGDSSLQEGHLAEAERFYRRALRLARDEAEPNAAMGMWALAAGMPDKARGWLRKASALDAENERTLRLRGRLDPAGQG